MSHQGQQIPQNNKLQVKAAKKEYKNLQKEDPKMFDYLHHKLRSHVIQLAMQTGFRLSPL